MRGAVSLAAVLLVSIAAIAMVALSYTAVKTPTRTTPSAQTGRCFWIDAEFEKRADGLGYDPYVIFRSDDGSGFDDIYLTRDGALVAGPNRWNKSNGPFVFYPQYTGGILRAGQTISYNGRDDNCGARGNSSTIACSVDQNGNLVETGSCKSRGGGGNQPPPTAIPTQPQSNNPQVCSGNTCNDCILTERDDILTYYRDTGGWDISCSNQTAIVNNWCGIDPTGCSIVKLNAYPNSNTNSSSYTRNLVMRLFPTRLLPSSKTVL
ncbi:hypothetical protein HYT02_00195 [Candidatus Gottesmanbacteria bacterium]|nr:hypothetical protein [Candidatus Gottesmanbacteria bacterium]